MFLRAVFVRVSHACTFKLRKQFKYNRMSVDENLKHQGTLEKQCKLKTWAWKKYWFVLFNEQLCYYKEQESAKLSGGRRLSSTELGEIDLSQAHAIKEIKNNNRNFAFEITTKSRNYVLSADKEETRTQWLKLLRQAMSLGISKRRINSIRSIKSSCNSIDEADDGYSDIQTTNSHRLSNGNGNQQQRFATPAPPPPTLNRPESTTLRHSIREEEEEDDLYTDIQTAESGENPRQHVMTSRDDDDDQETYSYAEVEMRKKKWKFMNQSAVDVPEEDDIYTEVGYDSVEEDHDEGVTSSTSPPSNRTSKPDNNEQTHASKHEPASGIVEYSKVLPKAQRLARTTSAITPSAGDNEKDKDYVHLRDVTQNKHATLYSTKSMLEFPTIPALAHPRVEYTDRSHFDDIRVFLSRNRGMDEVFRDPPNTELSGNSINKLFRFLSSTEQSVEPEIETTHL